MKKLSVNRSGFLLIVLFVVSSALMFFMMGLAYKQLEKLRENTNWMYHSQNISLNLEKLYANLKEIETERRDYILDKHFSDAASIIKKKVKHNDALLQLLKLSMDDHPGQQQNLAILQNLILRKYDLVESTFGDSLKVNATTVEEKKTSLLAGKYLMKAINQKVEEMQNIETRLLVQRRSAFLYSEKQTPVYFYVISLFTLGILGFAFFRIFRDFGLQVSANRKLKIAIETSELAEKVGNYGVWTFYAKSKEYVFSNNLLTILNIQMDQVSRDAMVSLMPEEDAKKYLTMVDKWRNGERTEPITLRYRDSDGNYKYLRTITERISSESGEAFLLGLTMDVTSETLSREELSRAYSDLKFYNESSAEAEKLGKFGFLQWIPQDKKFWFSDNFYRIFGMEPQHDPHDLRDFYSAIMNENTAESRSIIKKMIAGKPVEPFSQRIRRIDNGAIRYISITPKRMIEDGKVSYLTITKDITEETLDKQSLEDQNRILNANNQELQAFNYVASHDLQEPLRKIETFISRLIDEDFDNLSDNGKEYLERTKSSARRMRNLIDDLLQFSRSTRGENVFERCNLNQQIEETKDELQTQIEQKQATIIHGNLPVIQGIPFQVKQLFINLIGNSLKYSKADVPPVITISSIITDAKDEPLLAEKNRGKFHKIIFEDNGIGFDNNYSEKIFQLFSRLHGKNEYEGTGIGLSICKKIVENHKGYIYAEGQPEMGAKFILFFPVNIQ